MDEVLQATERLHLSAGWISPEELEEVPGEREVLSLLSLQTDPDNWQKMGLEGCHYPKLKPL